MAQDASVVDVGNRRKIENETGRPRIIGTDLGIGYRWLLSPEALPPR